MKDKFNEIMPNHKPDEILINKSDKLINKMKTLQSRIDDQVMILII
jgi:hypothetical protein